MRLIGLTGGIASGKSTVSNMLKSLGAIIIDADQVAREVVKPGQKALDSIVEVFGSFILNSDGTLNRKALGRFVFGDADRLEVLNGIIHPEVKKKIIRDAQDIRKRADGSIVILDVPLLIESGMDEMVEEVWLVYVDPETQVKRLMNRDRISLSEAWTRIRSQMPVEDKIKKSNKVIDNTRSLEYTELQVREIWEQTINYHRGESIGPKE